MKIDPRIKTAVVFIIHQHCIEYGVSELEDDVICKCDESFGSFVLHADHVAMKILDKFQEIENL
jgi:hypothetical protein